jgi:hypothetical protein
MEETLYKLLSSITDSLERIAVAQEEILAISQDSQAFSKEQMDKVWQHNAELKKIMNDDNLAPLDEDEPLKGDLTR